MLRFSDQSAIFVRRAFRARRDFERLVSENPSMCEDSCERTVVFHATRYGVQSDFLGPIGPEDVTIIGPEPREHLMARGYSARQRAMLDLLLEYLGSEKIAHGDARIYGHEAITHFALMLRGRFCKFIGTEYAKDEEQKRKLFPIPHADICASHFPDHAFDVVLSGDVFEHVPELDAALAETARILRKGGVFIGTFPFLYWEDRSIRRAKLQDGQVVHLEEPIYHGDPMNPEQGCLVFELPGWDVLERARDAGFSDASFEFLCCQHKGIAASHKGAPIRPRGVFLAVFRR